ncbi:MAG: glycosyltransferase family 4 protein [Clostridia bacterium]|nr:glycosyltransferase family 4 protein [Clostridia bacterium]
MKKKVLFLAQHFITLYSFRRELIEKLCKDGYDVFVSLPDSEDNKFFEDLGCTVIPTAVDRRGVNPVKDLNLIRFYKKMIPQVDPDIIFSYTIKPNIYGAFAVNGKTRKNGKPFRQVCNITGTGATFLQENFLSKLCRTLYRHSVRKSYKVFFQNTDDRDMFVKEKMVGSNYEMLPGSGVNLEQFYLAPLPEDDCINFIFIGRLMKLKGIDEYLEAAKIVKTEYPNTNFYMAGYTEDHPYDKKIKEYSDFVTPLGYIKDITQWIKKCHCTVLPSHGGEGVPNAILESSAMGRTCIGSNTSGTRDVIEDGKTGFIFEPGDVKGLSDAMKKIVNMSSQERTEMGLAGRKKVEKDFNRQIVVDKYIKEVELA